MLVPEPAGDRRNSVVIGLIVLALAAFTAVVAFNPAVAPAGINVRLALVIDATATLVALGVAGLAWVRYGEERRAADLFRSSAFLALASLNAIFVAVTIAGREDSIGLSLQSPGQLPIWATLIAKAMVSVLLVLAGAAALRDWAIRRWPDIPAVWLPSVTILGIVILGSGYEDRLPILFDSSAISDLLRDPGGPVGPASSPFLVVANLTIGLGFLVAGALAYRRYQRDRIETDVLLALGLTVAAFSQVHFAMHPGTYVSIVTTGDFLRVGFYGVMLLTLAQERRLDARQLHVANRDLRRLRETELAHATHEERARLAREIHDGLSQHLWFAKLKQGRLLQEAQLDGEPRQLATEVARAIESALAEARQAILALRPSDGATFDVALERYVADFADRFGIAASTAIEARTDHLNARTQAELLRIVQEALANVARHADATQVTVAVRSEADGLRLTVRDNGRGFDAAEAGDGYGLHSMQERAGLIGATLRVDTRPSDGTRVIVDLKRGEAHD